MEESVNRQMLVPVGVLGAVVALIGVLVVLGQAEEGDGPAPSPRAGAEQPGNAKAKTKAKAKAPTKVDRAKLLHVTDVPVERPDAPAGAPNVVLVTIDALRRDQLSAYDGPEGTTPFLDTLVAKGARFEDTVAAGPWSRPALVAMLTGQHAATVGMIEPGEGGNQRVLADGVTTLAERMQRAGWATVGATANFNNNHTYGMAQGFDAWLDAHPAAFNPRTRREASKTVEELFTLLDERAEPLKGRPVYAQVSFVDLHKPFMVPREEFAPFESDEHSVAPYRAMVKRTDDALRALYDGLAERGLTAENTVFAVVGAHGEGLSMPGHHGKQHGRTLYHSAVQVPWVVAGPGVKAGTKVGGLSTQADVLPTLLGLAGVELGEESLAGKNLAANLTSGAAVDRKAAFTDTRYFTADHAAVYTAGRVCQKDFGTTTGNAIPTGCYDRATDSNGDRIDATASGPLMDQLVEWRAARDAEYAAWPHVKDAK